MNDLVKFHIYSFESINMKVEIEYFDSKLQLQLQLKILDKIVDAEEYSDKLDLIFDNVIYNQENNLQSSHFAVTIPLFQRGGKIENFDGVLSTMKFDEMFLLR